MKQNSSEIATATARFSPMNRSADIISSFLSDRAWIIEASINEVLKHIQEREALRDRLLHEIDLQMCEVKGAWHRVAPWENSPLTIGDPKRRSSIEKLLADLEAEKRSETTSCWKDVASLRKELRELQRELAEEQRKARVMSV